MMGGARSRISGDNEPREGACLRGPFAAAFVNGRLGFAGLDGGGDTTCLWGSRMIGRLLAGALLALSSGAASAEDIGVEAAGDRSYVFVGAGYDDVLDKDTPAAGFLVEGALPSLVDWRPSWMGGTLWRLRPRAAVEVSSDGDLFAGAGLSLEAFPLGERLFLEASFLPGTYRRPGEYFPIQFRTQFGLGWQFRSGASLAFTVSHKSNNEWGPEGSSVETALLRWGVPLGNLLEGRIGP